MSYTFCSLPLLTRDAADDLREAAMHWVQQALERRYPSAYGYLVCFALDDGPHDRDDPHPNLSLAVFKVTSLRALVFSPNHVGP